MIRLCLSEENVYTDSVRMVEVAELEGLNSHVMFSGSMGGCALVMLNVMLNMWPHKAIGLREVNAVTLGGTIGG